EALIARYGAESKEMACALAEGVRRIGGTTLGLAETGIAGPVLGRSAKPLGSAFIALSGPEGTVCRSFVFEGGRQEIRHCIVEEALWMGVIYAGGDSERLTS
ncbi:MAG: CinA family protein, partial [bacterium]|nr:CinA family protein [bacterium]